MERWPADERQKVLPVKSQGRGNKRLQGHDTHYWNYPCLDYGTFGGATLVPSNGRLAWTAVVDTSGARRVTPVGTGHCVFPATRPTNPPPSRLAQCKRIEEGLNFVRTSFPDADFPAELVKAEFQLDEQQSRRLQVYDPLRGNFISIVPSCNTPQPSLVLFPVGETNSELNVSFITATSSNSSTFRPSGRAVFKFETPILQTSTWNISSPPPRHGTHPVLVRTLSATSLLNIEVPDDGADVKVTREVDILSDDAGGKNVVDAAFSPHHSDIMVVNTSGAVYNCTIYQGGKAVRRVGLNHVHFENANEDNFWRLHPSDHGYFLASSSCIKHFDLRTNLPAVELFSTDDSSPVVTSFDWLGREHLLALSTTSELIWLDERHAKKPLLGFKHNRVYDRSLRVRAVHLDDGPLTFLSSLKNRLVTVYDVSRGKDHLTHCHSVPASLPYDEGMGAPDSESTFFVQPDGRSFSLLRLSSQGSLHCQDFIVCRSDTDIIPGQNITTSHEWSADVQELAQREKELQPQYGSLSARNFSELDFRNAYQKIFCAGDRTEQATEGELVEMIDKLSQFWKRTNSTDKTMLTLYDICLRADEEPDEHSRAIFFADGIINSNHGYRALVRNELPIQSIASGAAWHCNFKPFLSRMGLGGMDNWEDMRGRLEAFNLSYSTPELFVQQEKESQEQLTVDLALSSMALSAHPISVPAASTQVGELESMSLATKSLTLDDELPEIQPAYLRPRRKVGINHYPDAFRDKDAVVQPTQDLDFSTPLGVRLLLREWEVGTDVESYKYCDPYNTDSGDLVSPPSQERTVRTAPVIAQTMTSSQRPPLVIAGVVPRPPPIHTALRLWETSSTQPQGFSGDVPFGNYSEPSQPSQELMTSTQVLPGPHGGRPAPSNKKPVKKRLGGF